MNKREIIERLKDIAKHAVHTVGKDPFIMSIDDGIAVHEAIELLNKLETNCSEIPNNSDTISRQQAIYVASGYCHPANIATELAKLPAVQPERKTGRWIEDAETYYKAVNEKGGGVNENTPYFTDCIACSECLSMFSVIDNETERFDFCPNCGADMRGDKHETD